VPLALGLPRRTWIVLTLVVAALLTSLVVYMHGPNMHGDQSLYDRYAWDFWAGDPPYRSLPAEYPLLALLPISLTILPPLTDFISVFAIWMLVLLVVFVIVLARRESPRVAEVFAVTIAIAGWGTVLGRYDLVPAFVTVLALWAARRRRFGPAYALLAVGVLLKLYPALFVPLVAMEQWRALGGVPLRTRPPRAVVAGVGLFCLLTAAGFAVAFLVNPAGWLGPFSYNAGRPIQLESVPATLLWLSGLLGFPTGPDKSFGSTNLVGQLSTPISLLADLALVAGLVWVYLRQAAGRLELTAAFAGCLLVVIATGRVLSPQYLIWVLPFLAILLRRFDPVWLAVCVLTVAEFPFGYLALHPGPPGHLAPYPGFLFVLIALRNAALVVAIVRFLIASSARAAAAAA